MQMAQVSIADPNFKDCVLLSVLPCNEKYPRLSDLVLGGILVNTYYRISKANGELKCFVTILPNKEHMGWVMCTLCGKHMVDCKCDGGIVQPITITYYYNKALHEKTGAPLLSTNELYAISPKFIPATNTKPTAKGTNSRGSEVINKRGSRFESKSFQDKPTKGMSIRDIENVDLGQVGATAQEMANAGLERMKALHEKKTEPKRKRK